MYKVVDKISPFKGILWTLNIKRVAIIQFITPGMINNSLPSPLREAYIQRIPTVMKAIGNATFALIRQLKTNAP
ncbi:MAG: hypothetical protein RMJ31_03620 [Nitrososphaerota archaeon]|nr:hypothetical protein [Nitrososphaerales archaeon]MCX8191346.1 hypothetical protein [Nitrososphaerales archaeon]MDW8044845.1 hypothetical protein [Nitrososphaerota archaeon]